MCNYFIAPWYCEYYHVKVEQEVTLLKCRGKLHWTVLKIHLEHTFIFCLSATVVWWLGERCFSHMHCAAGSGDQSGDSNVEIHCSQDFLVFGLQVVLAKLWCVFRWSLSIHLHKDVNQRLKHVSEESFLCWRPPLPLPPNIDRYLSRYIIWSCCQFEDNNDSTMKKLHGLLVVRI